MPANPHPNLRQCLEDASWRHLLAVAASLGLPRSTRWRKADLVTIIHAHLSQTSVLRQIVAALQPPALAGLAALLAADGALPSAPFTDLFGAPRPYRPWRGEGGEPWRAPASPAERLWYLGLLHFRAAAAGLAVPQVILPADLLDPLRELLPAVVETHQLTLCSRPGRPADPAWHVALLLATLAAEPLAPLAGRWLPPTALNAWAERTGLTQDPGYVRRRSERAQPYLAFLHLLAEAAGLIAGGARLSITPAGWRWLTEPPATRLQTLWRAWRAAATEAAQPYRFPWAAFSSRAHDLVIAQIGRLPLDRFTPLAQVIEAARLHDSYGSLAQPWGVREDAVASLIVGPLFWLGLVDVAQAGAFDPATAAQPAAPDVDDEPADMVDGRLQSALVRLTPVGAWLLGLPDWDAPPAPATQPCVVSPADADLVLVPAAASPLHLARLAALAEWLPPDFPALAQRLRLTSERIGRAVARGLPVPQLLHHLTEALGRPPGRRLAARLRAWAKAGQRARIRPLLVLETADATLMGQLRSRKLIRRRLGDVLSPTRSALDPAGLPAVLQHLEVLGVYPAVEGQSWAADDRRQTADEPSQSTTSQSTTSQSTASQSTTPPTPLSPADAGLLLMAGLTYQRLGEHLPLPMPVAYDTLDRLAAHLTPAQQNAARHAADQLTESLAATLAGYLGLPFWQSDSPAAEPLPLIEQAIAAKQDLVITYHGAGREQAVVRRVTPYWIERRNAVPYLIAYCHLREAERVFRVDRITDCQLLPRTAVEPPSTS